MTADSEIIGLTLELSRLLRRKVAVDGKGKGLNFIRQHALTFVKEEGGLSMKRFAALMNISPSSATAFADRLVAEGLVKRCVTPGNRKAVQLQVTMKGDKALAKAVSDKERVLSSVFRVLSAADRRDFRRILTAILAPHSR